jgi:hypothetical protein
VSDIDWNATDEVAVPQGTFVGWGEVGQIIVGEVVLYSDDGGSDFNGEPCPLVVLTLTAPAATFRDKGATREALSIGELVSITAGQANLRRKLIAAGPTPADVVRIEYTGNFKTKNGEGKDFKVQIARRSAPEPAVSLSDLTSPS